MNPKEPYVEASVGIHNIFKIVHVEYTRVSTILISLRHTSMV